MWWTEGCVLEERRRILQCFDRKDRLARKARIEPEGRRIWTCKKWEPVTVSVPAHDDLTQAQRLDTNLYFPTFKARFFLLLERNSSTLLLLLNCFSRVRLSLTP